MAGRTNEGMEDGFGILDGGVGGCVLGRGSVIQLEAGWYIFLGCRNVWWLVVVEVEARMDCFERVGGDDWISADRDRIERSLFFLFFSFLFNEIKHLSNISVTW